MSRIPGNFPKYILRYLTYFVDRNDLIVHQSCIVWPKMQLGKGDCVTLNKSQ